MKNPVNIPSSDFVAKLLNSEILPTNKLHSNPQLISRSYDGDTDDDTSSYCTTINASTSTIVVGMDSTSRTSSSPPPLSFPEADIAGSPAPLDRLEYYNGEMDLSNTLVRVTIRDIGELSESEESLCSSPVLTPSSSTTSLRSLSGEAELPLKLPINYSVSTLRISSSLESQDTTSQCPGRAEPGRVKDEENVMDPIRRKVPDQGPNPHTEDSNQPTRDMDIESLFQRKRPNIGSCGTRSLAVHHWNPVDEIRKAQSRFKRYGKETPVMQTDIQRGIIRVRPVAVDARENLCKIRVKGKETAETRPESKGEIAWWKWLASSLTKMCLGRTEGTDEDVAMQNMPGAFEESDVEGMERPPPAARVASG
jgi:hypothetical protein